MTHINSRPLLRQPFIISWRFRQPSVTTSTDDPVPTPVYVAHGVDLPPPVARKQAPICKDRVIHSDGTEGEINRFFVFLLRFGVFRSFARCKRKREKIARGGEAGQVKHISLTGRLNIFRDIL